MTLYYIEHIPTKKFYSPNTGIYRTGRNWRRQKGVLYTDENEAVAEVQNLVNKHRTGEQKLRIRGYGGYDASNAGDVIGDGYIRERDFRVGEYQV